jgi:two-component system cell cycle sensor histidine kinase PleC
VTNWLVDGMESTEGPLPGRIVDFHATPADILARNDAGLCLASGVAIGMGDAPIGQIDGPVLRRLMREEISRLERRTRDLAAEIKRMRRERKVLAAQLSHELRTPVSAISGYSELIGMELAAGRTVAAADHNDIVWEAAQSLLGVIDSILDFARVAGDTAHIEESDVDVPALARTVARMMATIAAARGSVIRISMPDDLPPLVADLRMTRQVLVNLVSNALKYGGEGGEVMVSARIDKRGRMIIDVRDRGPGMSADAIETAMKPFKRLAETTDVAIPGNGLGLPLVKALVELHEGSFQLISSQGRGTRAVVTMPEGRVRKAEAGQQEAFAFQRASDLFA